MKDPPSFKFEVLWSYLTAIQRQLHEGLAIEAEDPQTLINGRGEYGTNRIPRFKMTVDNEIIDHSYPKAKLKPGNTSTNPQSLDLVPGTSCSLLKEDSVPHQDVQTGFDSQLSQRRKRAKVCKASTEMNSTCQPPMQTHAQFSVISDFLRDSNLPRSSMNVPYDFDKTESTHKASDTLKIPKITSFWKRQAQG